MNQTIHPMAVRKIKISQPTIFDADNYQQIVRTNPPGLYAAIWPNVESISDAVHWELIDPEPPTYQKIFGSPNITDLVTVARSRQRQILNQQEFLFRTILSHKEAEEVIRTGVVTDVNGVVHQLLTEKVNWCNKPCFLVEVSKTNVLVRPSFVVSPVGLPDIWLYHSTHACWVTRFIKGNHLIDDFKKTKAVIGFETPNCPLSFNCLI